ncbi:MAG TPA: SDR family NAD(P)-dependent oxidoreductase [Vicinamibacteria bacterium]|nr:SDR family NAD(P)-dependent oxidoreductase [Vicinamibacteria bacterium]
MEYATYPSLRDRAVLVTGGASGIGASIVEHFALQGSRVAFLDRLPDPAEALVAGLSGRAPHAPVFLPCDVTDIAALRAAFAAAATQLGPVRVLVNNAANDDRHRLEEVTPEYWDERIAVNLRHYFFAAQAVVPGMKAAGGGAIVNLSSIAWVIPSTGLPVYVTAKAGIVGLTRTLARELGEANVRVNCVMPGAIATERQRRLWYTPEYRAVIASRQALQCELVPADVARLVLFLAADDASAITSQSYVVDGGWV